jgi:hypothetical protein
VGQSPSIVQGFAQPDAEHGNAPHSTGTTVAQLPVPVQVRVGWNCVPEHVAAMQTWLVPNLRQAPAPSHMPSFPHCSGVVAAQSS